MADKVQSSKASSSVSRAKSGPKAPAESATPPEPPAKAATPSKADQDLTAKAHRRSLLAWNHQQSTGARQAAEEAAGNGDHRRAAALFTTAAESASTQKDALDAAKAANSHIHDGVLGLNKHEEHVEAVATGIHIAADLSKTFKESMKTLDYALNHTDTEKVTGQHYAAIDSATDEAVYQALGTAETKDQLLQIKEMIRDYKSKNIVDTMTHTRQVLKERIRDAE